MRQSSDKKPNSTNPQPTVLTPITLSALSYSSLTAIHINSNHFDPQNQLRTSISKTIKISTSQVSITSLFKTRIKTTPKSLLWRTNSTMWFKTLEFTQQRSSMRLTIRRQAITSLKYLKAMKSTYRCWVLTSLLPKMCSWNK